MCSSDLFLGPIYSPARGEPVDEFSSMRSDHVGLPSVQIVGARAGLLIGPKNKNARDGFYRQRASRVMNFSSTDYRLFISTRTAALTDAQQQHIRATPLLSTEMDTLTIAIRTHSLVHSPAPCQEK